MPGPVTRDEIAALPVEGLLDRFKAGSSQLDRRLLGLSDEQLDTAFLPPAEVGRWPCRVLVGHLADAELAYAHRFRRAVAEDHPIFAEWDENAFIDAGLYGGQVGRSPLPVAGSVAVVHTLRLWTADWLASLMESDWSCVGLHPQYGEMSVRTMLVIDTWHLEHHAWFLTRKIEKLIAES